MYEGNFARLECQLPDGKFTMLRNCILISQAVGGKVDVISSGARSTLSPSEVLSFPFRVSPSSRREYTSVNKIAYVECRKKNVNVNKVAYAECREKMRS